MASRAAVRTQRMLVRIFAVIAGSAFAGCACAQNSVVDLVEECDVLAAHPGDPQRMAEGVDDDKIVPRLAILACEDAAKRLPDDPRFPFQLGRALLARGDKERSLKLFQEAAKKGHAAAYGYLGDAYQFGYAVPVDPAAAADNYKKAALAGFEAAKGQLDQLNFDSSIFAASNIIDGFFSSEIDRLHSESANSKMSPVIRNYIFTFTNQLGEECGAVVAPANVTGFYNYRYPADWTPQTDEPTGVAVQTAVGEYDAKAFLKRHGCNGPVAKHIFANLNTFFARYRK